MLQADTSGQGKITFARTGYVVYPQIARPEKERWQKAQMTPEERLAEAKADVEDELFRRFCRPSRHGWGRMKPRRGRFW